MNTLRALPAAPAIRIALVAALTVLGAGFACDPVHSDAIAALGDEARGVRKGPLHRPGQPCVTCHDGAIGSPSQFTVAGTIYIDQTLLDPAVGVTVALEDHNGATFHAITNEAGNFYVSPKEFIPIYPMRVSVVPSRGLPVPMTALIGRDGSCADCHTDPPRPTSAGHIFTSLEGLDGGTP